MAQTELVRRPAFKFSDFVGKTYVTKPDPRIQAKGRVWQITSASVDSFGQASFGVTDLLSVDKSTLEIADIAWFYGEVIG